MATSFEKAITGFESHLDAGRGYSANTVKAYLIDVQDLADFLSKKKIENIDDLNLEHLRDWL
ncbi:site-specific integrase, partial [Escherichia coli]|nr:recombinase XerC [Escherichia coli]